MDLRPYQKADLSAIGKKLKLYRRVIYTLPTGGGKTVVAATAAQRFLDQNPKMHCWFLVHRRELLHQAVSTMAKHGIEAGVIAAGFPKHPWRRLQVASVQTLINRIGKPSIKQEPELIIVDEAHHAVASTYRKIMEAFPEAWMLGLTATPERLDGKGLSDIANELYLGPTVADLCESGDLAKPALFVSETDIARVDKLTRGEIDQAQAAEAAARTITEAVSAIKQVAAEKKGIVFAVNVKHSKELAERLREAGMSAEHVDATSAKQARDQTFTALRSGGVQWVTNCNIISEGFDCPDAEAVVLARPTTSLSVYLQMVGRVMRPGADKLVLDLAGNILRHGRPEAVREWSLEGAYKSSREKRDQAAPLWACPSPCFFVNPIEVKQCQACGREKAHKSRFEEREQKVMELTAELNAPKPDGKGALREAVRNKVVDKAGLAEIAARYNLKPGWAHAIQKVIERLVGKQRYFG